MGSRIAYRKLQAPRRHGAALVDPAFRDVTDMLRRNLARRQSWARTDRGRLIAENRTAAREHLLRLATRLTRQYRDLERRTAPDPAAPIILAGHQPLLFHPGVWFKNFALDRLARRCDATAVHLSIDNDAPRTASIQVPTGSVTRPAAVAVAFDRAADARVPFEQGTIRDRSLFHSFGRRAEKTIAPLVSDPLLHEFWPMAIEAAGRTDNPGACLAQARHRLEERAGMATLEVPMSRVCDGDVFFRFVGWLLSDLPRLQAVFNDSLAEYRAVHRLRSRSHPVPDLARDGDWLEAPFWIWSDDRPQRRRLFARRIGRAVEITDRAGTCRQIDLPADGADDAAVAELGAWARDGVKIRSRALTTTMYARLLLGDLFLHGIGGAKYDQLTDVIIDRFFGIDPPEFMVLSATLLLPIPREVPDAEALRRNDRTLRDLRYNPDRHIGDVSADGRMHDEVSRLIAEKRAWLGKKIPVERLAERHRSICRVNAALQPFVDGKRRELEENYQRLLAALRSEAILASREYAFCLYPHRCVIESLLSLLPKTP